MGYRSLLVVWVFCQAPEVLRGLVGLGQEPDRVEGVVQLCPSIPLLYAYYTLD